MAPLATYIPQPRDFRRTMVFVDGTNLFYRLRGAGLRVSAFEKLFRGAAHGNVIRTYLYTTAPHHKTALEDHGANCFDGIRVTFGTAIPLPDGNYKEKGVDSLLVADMVYHAASKNCDNVAVVSTDVDFVHAIWRVEDFGCTTAVLAICVEAPVALRESCDRYISLSREELLSSKVACENRATAEETA